LTTFITGAIVLQLSAFYLKRLQKPMRPKGKKIYSFFLTKYTDNYFLVSLMIYLLIPFEIVDYSLLIVPVMIYANADIQKKQILQDNKVKAGVYL